MMGCPGQCRARMSRVLNRSPARGVTVARRVRKFEGLCDAIGRGTAADVRQLLAGGADPNEIEEAGDVTPLMDAAAQGNLEIVKALVEAGADVNALAQDLSGDLEEFEFLDEAFQHAELHGLTALVYATLYGHSEVKKYLARLTNAELRAQARAIGRRAQHYGEG
jgi:ankyrin repeat protein